MKLLKPLEPLKLTPTLLKAISIHLICEELKSRRFFEALRDLGLDDAFYQADLIDYIMESVQMYRCEENYTYCANLLTKHSTRVTQDGALLLLEAKRVYALMRRYATRKQD